MSGFLRVTPRRCRKSIAKVAEIANVWITQDADGTVQMWDEMPKMNVKQGYWEISGRDSNFIGELFKPYCSDWTKSLVTPRSVYMRGVVSDC